MVFATGGSNNVEAVQELHLGGVVTAVCVRHAQLPFLITTW